MCPLGLPCEHQNSSLAGKDLKQVNSQKAVSLHEPNRCYLNSIYRSPTKLWEGNIFSDRSHYPTQFLSEFQNNKKLNFDKFCPYVMIVRNKFLVTEIFYLLWRQINL